MGEDRARVILASSDRDGCAPCAHRHGREDIAHVRLAAAPVRLVSDPQLPQNVFPEALEDAFARNSAGERAPARH